MATVLLLLVAAAVYFGLDTEKATAAVRWVKSKVDARTAFAAGLVFAAILLLPSFGRREEPPVPDVAPFSLRGVFRGPTASADASLVGSLLCELADEIEWDGKEPEPAYRTGAQLDQLRKTARVMRCRGESIGDRQPLARDKIAEYLEQRIGTDAGTLDSGSRDNWVSGLREAGEAARDAAQ